MLCERSRNARDDDIANEHARRGDDPKRATSEPLDEGGRKHGDEEVEDDQAAVDTCNLCGICNADLSGAVTDEESARTSAKRLAGGLQAPPKPLPVRIKTLTSLRTGAR
jgi:hypothetical protein